MGKNDITVTLPLRKFEKLSRDAELFHELYNDLLTAVKKDENGVNEFYAEHAKNALAFVVNEFDPIEGQEIKDCVINTGELLP